MPVTGTGRTPAASSQGWTHRSKTCLSGSARSKTNCFKCYRIGPFLFPDRVSSTLPSWALREDVASTRHPPHPSDSRRLSKLERMEKVTQVKEASVEFIK